MATVVKSLFGAYICLSTLINPLLCFERSYSNLQETVLFEYQHPAVFIDVVSKQKSLQQQHQLVKRQNLNFGTPENEAYCLARISDASCSTGLAQASIDVDLTCGRVGIEEAKRLANGCAKNERGQYCSSAFTLFNVDEMGLTNIEGNCSGVLVSESCPTACRTLLEDFRSRLGCCINILINGSRKLSASVDHRVWNLCDVPLPAADCGNSLTVNPPDDVQQCTIEQYFNKKYTQNLCLPERGQSYVDAIVLDSRCNQTSFFISAEYVTNFCSMDDSGTICGLTYSGADSEVQSENLNSICATSNVSCTSNCRDSISNATMLRGCCLNWINTSTYTPQALSYGVWKSCGVESPGFCESQLSLRGTATSIMEENHLNSLLIIFACLIYQYVNVMGLT